MKISLSSLESARRGLTNFVAGGGDQFFRRRSYAMYWKKAIRIFHLTSGSREAAFQDFLQNCQEHFADRKTFQRNVEKYASALEDYCNSYEESGLVFVETEKKVSLSLSAEHSVTGVIPRLDMVLEGGCQYSVAFISTTSMDLELELRSKLIQRAIACEFGVVDSEIQIGQYSNSNKSHSFFKFRTEEIDDGVAEAINLIDQIESLTVGNEES